MSSTTSRQSCRKSRNTSVRTSKDLVKSVSKQMKHYFEIRRQEDGFDLSGPDCPRPHYPALKSRPMLLYEGLHDKSVKHFFSDNDTKAHITHMNPGNSLTPDSKKVKKLMRKEMDRITFVSKPLLNFLDDAQSGKPQWMGTGGRVTGYTKNSEKYTSGTFGEWKTKESKAHKRGYGKPEPTLKSAFKGDRRLLRSTVPSWIDNKECTRLVNEASKILSTSEMKYLKFISSRPQTASSYRSSRSQTSDQSIKSRPRSASPQYSESSPRYRNQRAMTYQQAKHQFIKSHEEEKTRENLRKGKFYYDIDGRRHPVKHKVKNSDGYLDRSSSPTKTRDSSDSVPDWLRDQMKSQDVEEKRMPYNRSVRPVEVPEKDTAKGEDPSQRVGVRRRPKSAKITKTPRTAEHDDITLSDGSYEEVPLDATDSEDEYVEDKACQTGWELFVQYDQSEHILPSDQPQSDYRVIVRTGSSIGASTKALIHIILYGIRGRTQEMFLEKCDNHKIPFQQGAEDIFVMRCSFVGKIKQIQIGHDSIDLGDAWFLDSVTVEDLQSEQVYEFLCDQWMSSRTEDKLTKRILENTAIRKLKQASDRNTDKEDDVTDRVIDDVARTNSPKDTDEESERQSSIQLDTLSTSHLNNTNTPRETPRADKSLVSTESDTSSTYRFNAETKTKPVAPTSSNSKKQIIEERRNRSPIIPEDFESDITNPSVKRSDSVPSERTKDDESECQTAVFGEDSLTVRSPRSEADSQKEFMEGFKAEDSSNDQAGQMAAAQAQREREEQERLEEEKKRETVIKGQSIHLAAKSGNTDRINEILNANIELIDSTDDRGNSALHIAVKQGHSDIVKILASRGAFLQLRNQAGYEPMHVGAQHGFVKCMNVLHAMGASVNTKTDDQQTPLHLAAMNNNIETSKWLISNRCELELEDEYGRTALDLAINFNHSQIEDLIRKCMSDNSPLKQLRSSKSVEWEDDRKESERTNKPESDEDPDGSSIADLRQARDREDLIERKKSYEMMKQREETSNMSFLDLIRAEAENEES